MTVKVSPKFQVVIPVEVRDTLGIHAGSKMEVIAKGRVAYLVPVTSVADLKRTLKGRLSRAGLRDKKDRKL